MAQFVTNESSEDSFTLSATQSWHLNTSNYIVLNQATQVQAFTAAQFSGVHIYALDHNNAQLLLDRQAFVGYLLNPNDQTGLSNIALPAGQWWIGVTYSGSSLSGGQTVAGFDEVSTVSLPGASFIGNVPMGVGGNAGAWSSQGFTISGTPSLYIETEGSGGKFMIQTASQYQAFQSAYGNGYGGGSYSFIYALGGTSGGAETEIEGQLQLPAGTYYLTWVNDSGGWAGGAADISAFGSGSVSADAATPSGPGSASNTGRIAGAHTQYIIANNNGGLYIQDLVPGRDGTQNLPAGMHIQFTDGTGVFDATGKTEDVSRLYRAAFGRTPDQIGLENVTAPINNGTLGLSDVAMYFVSSPEFTTRYGSLSNDGFVGQLYRNVLGRTGSAQEVNAWTDQINHGMSRGAVLVGFSNSFENKVGAISYSGDKDYGEAYRLYQAAFNRTPDTPGLRGWVTNLDNGMSLNAVAQGFVGSVEFANTYAGLSSADFVNQLYQNVLHRAGEASGVSGWVGQLNAGASRASVLLGFSDSLENRVNTAASTHDSWVYLNT